MTSASVPSKWMFVMFLGTFFALFVSRLEDVAIPVTTKNIESKKMEKQQKENLRREIKEKQKRKSGA
jgi:hypothetical protein